MPATAKDRRRPTRYTVVGSLNKTECCPLYRCSTRTVGCALAGWLPLARKIEFDCRADEIFQGGLIDLVAFVMSMARLTFPSKLELKRPEASFKAAPLAKVILTTSL